MIGRGGENKKKTPHIKNAIIVKISFPAQGLPVIIMAAMTALLICLVAKVPGIFFSLIDSAPGPHINECCVEGFSV